MTQKNLIFEDENVKLTEDYFKIRGVKIIHELPLKDKKYIFHKESDYYFLIIENYIIQETFSGTIFVIPLEDKFFHLRTEFEDIIFNPFLWKIKIFDSVLLSSIIIDKENNVHYLDRDLFINKLDNDFNFVLKFKTIEIYYDLFGKTTLELDNYYTITTNEAILYYDVNGNFIDSELLTLTNEDEYLMLDFMHRNFILSTMIYL